MNYMWKCTFNTAAFVGIPYFIVYKHPDMNNIKITKINKSKFSTPTAVTQDNVQLKWQQLTYSSHVQCT